MSQALWQSLKDDSTQVEAIQSNKFSSSSSSTAQSQYYNHTASASVSASAASVVSSFLLLLTQCSAVQCQLSQCYCHSSHSHYTRREVESYSEFSDFNVLENIDKNVKSIEFNIYPNSMWHLWRIPIEWDIKLDCDSRVKCFHQVISQREHCRNIHSLGGAWVTPVSGIPIFSWKLLHFNLV